MKCILNFREVIIDNYNIDKKRLISGNIFRSALSFDKNSEDLYQLKSYGIKYIYDLRSYDEINNEINIYHEYFNVVDVDIIKHASPTNINNLKIGSIFDYMNNLYTIDFLKSDGFSYLFKNIIEQASSSFLIHCKAGKDRTGIAISILLIILGFSIEDVKKEYLIIDDNLILYLKKQFNHSELHSLVNDDLLSVKGEYFDSFINSVLIEYDSFDNYTKNKLCLDESEINLLKERYLI